MNSLYQLHDGTVEDLTSFLTEYAQLKRVHGDHETAERAEVVRNTINAQG